MFDYDGSVTTEGKLAGAFSGTVKDYIKNKHNVELKTLDEADLANLDPVTKTKVRNAIVEIREAGYGKLSDEISSFDAVIPFNSTKYGVSIGAAEATKYKTETDKTKENNKQQTGNI